ncbi:hypothetical protein [Streptomyces sp. NPDC086787]|uniref:hypothetical protein n=1 Tax=Streptomyces sp. NPDC086787 TaxID=3365759 RepID=UPI0037FBF0AF
MSDARSAIASIRRRGALPLLVCLLYAVFQLGAGPQWTLFPDSYRYARAAEQYLGASRQEAHREALAAFCTSRAAHRAHDEKLQPEEKRGERAIRSTEERACLDRWADAPDITTGDPRYQAIFSSRPGYPLLAAPFVGAFGVLRGMRLLGLVTAAAASLMVYGLLRGAGLARRAALTGQLAFLATPLGWWSAQALGEGLFTVCVLGILWGGLLLFRRRSVPGAVALTALSYGAAVLTRYSSVLVLAALLAAVGAGAFCFSRDRRLRHAGTVALVGVSTAAAAAVVAAMRVWDLPSSQVTLQDTFTHHFTTPDVAHPWSALLQLATRFWRDWAAQQIAAPGFLLLTALAVWALARYGEGLGGLALATGVGGVLLVSAHPLVQEADRLAVLMWMPVVLGLPLAVDRHLAVRPLPPRTPGEPGEDPDRPPRQRVARAPVTATEAKADSSG